MISQTKQLSGSESETRISKPVLAGLFLVSAATLSLEILLGRIFSVTLGYHFAFIAISMAMFGLTAGALIVFTFPGLFIQERAKKSFARFSLFFAVSIFISLALYLNVPFSGKISGMNMALLIFNYGVISVPFIFSGIVICLILRKYHWDISYVYSANLLGAAIGVLAVVGTLAFIDCLSAVIAAGLIAGLAAYLFAVDAGRRLMSGLALGLCVLYFGLFGFNTIGRPDTPPLRLTWVKGRLEKKPLYERWNSYSRITIREKNKADFFLWGPSPAVNYQNFQPEYLVMQIDGDAGSQLSHFNGDLKKLDYLRYDLTNFVHHLRQDADVCVVGVGGGRDVLSALVFQQKNITAIDINGQIVHAVNKRFGDYTGHLDDVANVRFAVDEARSFLSRTADQFDIIQIALIDTWAATGTGAYALSENVLYTVEAWKTFFQRLHPGGYLSVSRWYEDDTPAEVYRLVSLATASLEQLGITDPRAHILVVRNRHPGFPDLGTILVKKTPFTPSEIAQARTKTETLRFEIVLSPDFAFDKIYAILASPQTMGQSARSFPLNIEPPTDDKPFFFHMVRLQDAFNPFMLGQGVNRKNMEAVFTLMVFSIAAGLLAGGLVLAAWRIAVNQGAVLLPKDLSLVAMGLGFGFIFIEVAFMQRFIIFLGHPTYSLSVILFCLLLYCGAGSFLTSKIPKRHTRHALILRLGLLVIYFLLTGLGYPFFFRTFHPCPITVRVGITALMLLPAGLLMGMAFPLVMKLTASQGKRVLPWLWGVNGAASVFGSVIATVIAVFFGITWLYVSGVVLYMACLAGIGWLNNNC